MLRYPNLAEEHGSEPCQCRFKSDSEYQPHSTDFRPGQKYGGRFGPSAHPSPNTGAESQGLSGETGSIPNAHPNSKNPRTRGKRMIAALQHPKPAQATQLHIVRRAGTELRFPFLWRIPRIHPSHARYLRPTHQRNLGMGGEDGESRTTVNRLPSGESVQI